MQFTPKRGGLPVNYRPVEHYRHSIDLTWVGVYLQYNAGPAGGRPEPASWPDNIFQGGESDSGRQRHCVRLVRMALCSFIKKQLPSISNRLNAEGRPSQRPSGRWPLASRPCRCSISIREFSVRAPAASVTGAASAPAITSSSCARQAGVGTAIKAGTALFEGAAEPQPTANSKMAAEQGHAAMHLCIPRLRIFAPACQFKRRISRQGARYTSLAGTGEKFPLAAWVKLAAGQMPVLLKLMAPSNRRSLLSPS